MQDELVLGIRIALWTCLKSTAFFLLYYKWHEKLNSYLFFSKVERLQQIPFKIINHLGICFLLVLGKLDRNPNSLILIPNSRRTSPRNNLSLTMLKLSVKYLVATPVSFYQLLTVFISVLFNFGILRVSSVCKGKQ